MQDKNVFDPEKISLIDFKMIKGQVDTPENFDINKVVGHQLDNSLQLGFNLDDKLAKADFTISVKTDSKGENESEVTPKKKVMILGSGPNRIGQGIEFDYSCTHAVLAAKELGYETIMVNCNPETVSTDFDIADKLYFEPVFWERVLDIFEHEKPEGVIVQLGGQTALKLAEKLDRNGIKIKGTTFKSLDLAEDRGSFSKLLQENKIPYPEFDVAETAEEALLVADKLDFPILVRHYFVLGGQGIKIVINIQEL
jgi:carbamoyl-phosphate synthase large subunit